MPYDLPADLGSFVDRLQNEAAELRAIRDAAADRSEQDQFDRLAAGLSNLADRLERLLAEQDGK